MNKHFLWLLLVSSLLAAVVAFAWARSRGVTVVTQFSYHVDTVVTPAPASVYGYDGYYHLQAAEAAARTFAAWLSTPEVAAAALRAAGVAVPFDTRQLSGVVAVTQPGPQVVAISISNSSTAGAQAVAQGLQAQASAYADTHQLTLVSTTLLTGGHGLRSGVVAAAVFLGTAFLGINLFLLKRAFNEYRH